jgi:hypothetical protein
MEDWMATASQPPPAFAPFLAVLAALALTRTTHAQISSLARCSGSPQVMYACDAAPQLLRVDNYATAPTAATIGSLGGQMTDLAVDPVSGQMYGCTFLGLWSIDKNSAVPTFAAPFGSSLVGLNALDFSPLGVLHGYSNAPTADLVTLDPLTGLTSVYGALMNPSGGDFAFSGNTTA